MKQGTQGYSKEALWSRLRLEPTALAIFERYIGLLERWGAITNLVSREDMENIWFRHIVDCLPLLALAPEARSCLDIGSGAGFPGVVLAIQLLDVPEALIHLVESDTRKCVFLREVMRELQLPMRVHNRRVETLSPSEIGEVNAITARAFASVSKIMKIAMPFINSGAIAVLPRGKRGSELDELDVSCYSIHDYPNPHDVGGGHILLVEKRTISELA